jgi:NAD(P)-dependent dehydrogenase (short-subunit alcohol dehydrogenase family)
MAKAALNQQTKTIAQAFNGGEDKIIFIALNPGYVATKLTGWKGEDDMETSVKGMVDIIDRVELSDSGLFFDYTGVKLEF